jgi:hypothetical protein
MGKTKKQPKKKKLKKKKSFIFYGASLSHGCNAPGMEFSMEGLNIQCPTDMYALNIKRNKQVSPYLHPKGETQNPLKKFIR